MELYQILCLVGVPTVSVGIVGAFCGLIKKQINDNKALKKGVQAMLRHQMVTEYRRAIDNGYATIEDRELFFSLYEQYHNLGGNGVMTSIAEKYDNLPTSKK